jgi:hypothetical protein
MEHLQGVGTRLLEAAAAVDGVVGHLQLLPQRELRADALLGLGAVEPVALHGAADLHGGRRVDHDDLLEFLVDARFQEQGRLVDQELVQPRRLDGAYPLPAFLADQGVDDGVDELPLLAVLEQDLAEFFLVESFVRVVDRRAQGGDDLLQHGGILAEDDALGQVVGAHGEAALLLQDLQHEGLPRAEAPGEPDRVHAPPRTIFSGS